MKRQIILALPAIALATSLAWAEEHDHGNHDHTHDHGHHGHDAHAGHDHGKTGSAKSEATRAYEAANARMHDGMNAALTGDADVDFMKGMIPHHQGAIDMAEIVLKYGKDAETRKLAEEIIEAQTKEIALMKEWLAKRGAE